MIIVEIEGLLFWLCASSSHGLGSGVSIIPEFPPKIGLSDQSLRSQESMTEIKEILKESF